MKESEVVTFWKMLRHQNETELRAIMPGSQIYNFHFSTQEELLNLIKRYEGTYNLYLGVNERSKGGTKAEHVLRLGVIPIDIDCVNKPAKDEDIIEAMEIATKIIAEGESQGYKKPFVSFSGNGYQLYYCIPPIELTQSNFQEIESKVQEFERKLKAKYDTEKVRLDNVGDLPRIMRIPSTFNIKSKTYSSIVNGNFEEDFRLRDDILNLRPLTSKNYTGTLSEEIKEKIKSDSEVERLMNGELVDKPSRSEAEMMLVCKLVRIGLTKEEIYKAMALCRIGKWQEANQSYRELTYQKAISAVTQPTIDIVKEVNKKIDDELKNADESVRIVNLRNKVATLLALNKTQYRREASEEIVKWISSKEHIKTTKIDENNEVWIYFEGIYIPNGKAWIKEICRFILRELYTPGIVSEVIAKIEADTFIDPEIFFKETAPEWIPVKNGLLNVFAKELIPFTPDKIFFTKLPIEYNPNAKCPSIDKFLGDVLKNPEADIKIIHELFGYCILKDYRFEKAFMFLGSGRNGKSKTLELLRRFVGLNNCVSISLQEIDKDNFAVSLFHTKLLNVVGDLSPHALENTGKFKEITGTDMITANRKFLSRISFLNYAKQVFSANTLPKSYDLTPAFFNRWIILEFPYTFLSQKEIESIKDTQELKKYKLADKSIIEQISTPEELSGMLNKALDGLDRLIGQRDFSYSPSVQDVKNLWIRKSDSLQAFLIDCIESEPNANIRKSDFRREYSDYCNRFQLIPSGDKHIKETLTREMAVSEDKIRPQHQPGFDYGNQFWIWSGIKFKKRVKDLQ